MENSAIWQLINPEGMVETANLSSLNPRPGTLDNRTVMLRWNGKHNGDIFLNRVAELLVKNARGLKIIRGWEVAPETVQHSYSPDKSKDFARKLASFRPDIVIGAQAD